MGRKRERLISPVYEHLNASGGRASNWAIMDGNITATSVPGTGDGEDAAVASGVQSRKGA
jgi:hypothetical protein